MNDQEIEERLRRAEARIALLKTNPPIVPFRGIPRYFRGCCQEAKRSEHGGYSHAGYHLAIHIDAHAGDYGYHPETWDARKGTLRAALRARDETAIWRWFQEEYPRCLALVPGRRKPAFVAGVLQSFDDGRIPLGFIDGEAQS